MKFLSILKKYYYIIALFLLTSPFYVFASGGAVNLDTFNPIGQNSVEGLIAAVLQFVVKIGAVVVVFFVIYAGFQFVTAQGNEEKITKARKSFLWTIIGALILLGAMTLSGVICRTANDLGANVSCSN